VKVFVVVADYGLNGADCRGVFTTKPTEADLERIENTPWDPERPHHTPRGVTGYSGLEIEEMEVTEP
jgi:hypothetical protein